MKGIYKISSPSGRVYIGQSSDIEKRWNGYRRSVSSKQRLLFRSFTKYGHSAHSFLVLHELPTDVSKKTLDEYEIFYINQFKKTGHRMLNIGLGGIGGRQPDYVYQMTSKRLKGSTLSQEQKNKISKSNSGKIRTREQRVNISNSKKGRVMSEEQRQKISNKLKGRISPNKGKKSTPECIELKRKNATGRKHSEESKKKMSENNFKRWAEIKSKL